MKFKILETVTTDVKKRIEGKKVCDVVEYTVPSLVGPYKGWIGSVEDEYFSVALVKGIVSVSLEEREMKLGWNIIRYAIVEHLHTILTSKKFNTKVRKQLIEAYNDIGSDKDIELITFKDVMTLLKWKFKSRKVKVDEYFLN